MDIRQILVPLSGQYDPEDPEGLDLPALTFAFLAARQLDAHVEAVCILKELSVYEEGLNAILPQYGADALVDLMERDGAARQVHARSAYDRVLADQHPRPRETAGPAPGFSARFVEVRGEIQDTVGRIGRLSDMIVIANAHLNRPFRPVLEACLRRTARPTLVSPPKAPKTFATRIAIAWNDSAEAARAVSAAIPLMQRAEKTTVISCTERSDALVDPAGLVDHLAWHGIDADAVPLTAPPRGSSAAIIDAALAAESDLIVLGAYIHFRAHSLLFGSLTERVLDQPRMPALIVP